MFGNEVSILHCIRGVAFGRAGAPTLEAAQIIASLFIGGIVWRASWFVHAGLRAAGWIAVLIAVDLGVRSAGWVAIVDANTTGWMVDHRSAGADSVAMLITNLGAPAAVGAAGVIGGALLALRAGSWFPGLLLVGMLSSAGLACLALKHLLGRARPDRSLQMVAETDPSFPSGHVTGTTTLVGIVALFLAVGAGGLRRWVLAAVGAATVLVVGISRVYLGVHWVSDIVGGVALGMVFVTAADCLISGWWVGRTPAAVTAGRSSADGEGDGDASTAARMFVEVHRSLMCGNDFGDNRQSEPGATRTSRPVGVQADESVEDP